MSDLTGLSTGVIGIAGVAAWCLWTSRMNQHFFFGRTLDNATARSAEAVRITRRYKARILTGSGAALAVFSSMRADGNLPHAAGFVLALLLQVIVFCVAFARAHGEAGRVFGEAGEPVADAVEISLRPGGIPLYARPAMFVLPPAAATLAWLTTMVASHSSFRALSDAVGRSGGAGLCGFALGLLSTGTLFCVLMRYTARFRTPMAQCTLRTMFWVEWLAVAALTAAAVAGAMHIAITASVTSGMIVSVLAATAAYALWSRSRMRQFAPPAVEQRGDEFWRWGLFYRNEEDPALFVQARMGPGFTLNFGRLLAWPIAAAAGAWLALVLALSLHRF